MLRIPRLFVLLATAGCLCHCANRVSQTGADAGTQVTFVDDIKPILQERCVMCHNSETLPGRLNFESAKGAFVNDKQGRPYIVPGKPEESRLYTAVMLPDFYDLAMPPVSHRVSKQGVEKIRQWIAAGADWPAGPEGRIVATEKVLE